MLAALRSHVGVASSYTVDRDYPKLIGKAWTGVWSSDLDAAVVWPDGKTYLFKGPEFVRCAKNEHTADGAPRAIADHFPRLSEAFP